MGYEYTVIPAPSRGEKAKGSKTGIERFSVALAGVLNEMAQDGWEYVRAETLPCEERAGLTGRTTVYHNILVFRRALDQPEDYGTELIDAAPAPVRADPQPHDLPADEETAEPAETGVRAPFSQPMRATPRPAQAQSQSPGRMTEPPLSAPEPQPHNGPRLGPANR